MTHHHEGGFAEGQAREEHHPEDERGAFAQAPDRPDHDHEGSFAEGQEQAERHREDEQHGDFAKGQEREGS